MDDHVPIDANDATIGDVLFLHMYKTKILQEINCTLVNKIIAFNEDPQVNRSYLVLENAGEKTLTQFMKDVNGNKGQSQTSKGLRDDEVR